MKTIKLDIIDLNLSLQGFIIDNSINIYNLSIKEKIKMYKTLFNKNVVIIPVKN